MADSKITEWDATNSIAKLLGLDSDGNGKVITSQNLLSGMFQDRGKIPNGSDLNTFSYGLYQIYPEFGTVLNGPTFVRFILICFNSGGHIAQLAINVHPGMYQIQYRTSHNNRNTWDVWKSITIT